jgi:predicted nucleotidyltransferase
MRKQTVYEQIRHYFKDKPVQKVEVIGSYARDEANYSSDVDIIITLSKPVSLFQISRYRLDLMQLLRIEVDLTTKEGIDTLIKPYIEEEIETIYERA